MLEKHLKIQRGRFRKKIKINKHNIPNIFELIDVCYSKSGDFGFVTLNKSVRKTYENRFEYTAIDISINDKSLIVVYPKEIDIDEYQEVLNENLNKTWKITNEEVGVDFWWDISNDIFFSTHENIIWIIDAVCSSIKYLDKS